MKYLSLNLFVFVFFIFDRLLKYYFFKNPAEIFSGGFLFGLNFRFEKNFGIAFGFSVNRILLIFLTVFLILILFSFLIKAYQRKDSWEILGFSFIVFGAISNLIDRLRFGFVIDYIDLPIFTVFNIADCLISAGVVVFLVSIGIHSTAGQIKNIDIK